MPYMKHTKTGAIAKLADAGSYVLAAVIVLLPLHAFLTVAAGSLTGQYELVRLWKEFILLALLPLAAVLVWKTPGLWQRLRGGWLFWTIATYVVLHILLGVVSLLKGQVNYYALLYAWVVNLRFLLVFVIALALASRSGWLLSRWKQLVLWPAVLVVGFGMLQTFALPTDFLRHFGYNTETIAPFETVDEKLDYIRIQSTLRGANPLGAYLVVVLAALTVLLLLGKDRDAPNSRRQLAGVTMFSAALIVLMVTYSRSAYIGATLAVLLAVWLVLKHRRARQRLAAGLVIFALVAGSAALVFRENDRFENTFFHTDEHSTSPISSNEGRLSAMQAGMGDVASEPFGRGPGTAGPASQHNLRPERIAENYYLQLGQEVGWIGLALFLAINGLVARELWRRRESALARVLLASLAGIAFIGLLQHVWTDDTLALIWWALAGVALALGSAGLKVTPAIISVSNKSANKPASSNDTKTGKTEKHDIPKTKPPRRR